MLAYVWRPMRSPLTNESATYRPIRGNVDSSPARTSHAKRTTDRYKNTRRTDPAARRNRCSGINTCYRCENRDSHRMPESAWTAYRARPRLPHTGRRTLGRHSGYKRSTAHCVGVALSWPSWATPVTPQRQLPTGSPSSSFSCWTLSFRTSAPPCPGATLPQNRRSACEMAHAQKHILKLRPAHGLRSAGPQTGAAASPHHWNACLRP
jgi:hypothetical protein